MKMIFNFINKRLSSMLRFLPLVLICLLLSSPAAAQEPKGIQDNSFLIEESYNQEAGVVQEINFFTWSPSTHSWLYSFTNEWPVTGIKHQFSYTLTGLHSGDFGGSGAGVGDYRAELSLSTCWRRRFQVCLFPRASVCSCLQGTPTTVAALAAPDIRPISPPASCFIRNSPCT